ncbi:MAG: HEPN domain-containing protein [Clostridium sp.]
MPFKLKKYRGIDWIPLSRIHYETSKILFENKGDLGVVCFHLHQGIEKMLKGYIVIETGELIESHSITELLAIASNISSELLRFREDAPFINTFYIQERYPGEDPIWVKPRDVCYAMRIYKEINSIILEDIQVI